MREIKFRAILRHEARTAEEYAEYDAPIYFTLDDLMRGKVTFLDPLHWVFSQWTGLKDKNSREICEGDVVRYGELPYQIMEIKFETDKWEESYYHYSGFVFPDGEDNLEIIGNIYEHPDLLTPNE